MAQKILSNPYSSSFPAGKQDFLSNKNHASIKNTRSNSQNKIGKKAKEHFSSEGPKKSNKEVDIAPRTYTPKKNDHANRVLIDKIVNAKGREISQKDTYDLCIAIEKSTNFTEALDKVYRKVYTNPNCFQATHTIDRAVYKKLLLFKQNDFKHEKESNWESKKYLFSKIPTDFRVRSIFHCFIEAANQEKDFSSIRDAFHEVSELGFVNAALIGIFIKLAWKYGDATEAQLALEEAEKRNWISPQMYNIYLNGSIKKNRNIPAQETIEKFRKIKKTPVADVKTFNIFINNAWGLEYLHEAGKAFEEAKRDGIADESTYASYMNALGRNGMLDKAKTILEEAKKENKINLYAWNSYLLLARENGDFQEVKKTFEDLKSNDMLNSYSYSNYMWALSTQGNFEEIDTIFNEAKQEGKIDVVTYTCYLTLAGKFKKLDNIKAIFQEAKDHQLVSIETFNSYILAVGNCGDFIAAEDVFEELKILKRANIGTFTNFIKAAGINREFQKAKNAFLDAKKFHLAGISVYTSFIDTAGRNHEFIEAKKAFKEIEEDCFIDTIAFTRYMEAAGANGAFLEAKRAFEKAKRLDLVDTIFFNTFIDIAGQFGEFQLAREVFKEAKMRNLATIITYSIFINIAGAEGEFQAAQETFDEARSKEITDTFSYNTFMNAAAECGQYQTAKMIFDEIQDLKIANTITFTNYIQIACNFKEFEDARKAFESAIKFNPLEISFYNVFIDKMGNNGFYPEAKKAFECARRLKVADYETHAAFINVAGNNNKYQEAKECFVEAKNDPNLATTILYASFLNAAGKNEQYEDAQETIKEAEKRGLVDILTYSNFMNIAAQFGKFREAKETLKIIEDAEIADSIAYGDFIHILGLAKEENLKEIRSVFERAKKRDLADANVYNNFIHVVGKKGDFKSAKSAFEDAKRLRLGNPFIFASFITAAAKNGQFLEAQKAFLEAEKNELFLDQFVYTAYMEAARKNGEYQEVLHTFEKAKKIEMTNQVTYSIMMQTLETAEFEDFLEVFHEARKLRKVDSFIYSTLVRVAGKKGKFHAAKEAFKEAKELGYNDEKLYQFYIQAAGINLEFQEAKKAFEEAKKIGKANAFTYSFFINAMGRIATIQRLNDVKLIYTASYINSLDRTQTNQTLEEPRKIFWEAKELGHLNTEIVNQFINILGQCREFEEAEKILTDSENRPYITSITHNILMNWKIQTSCIDIPSVQPISSLSGEDQSFLNSLLSPSYRLLNRLRERQNIPKDPVNDEYKESERISFPQNLKQKLLENIDFLSRDEDFTFKDSIQNMLKEYANAAAEQNVQIEHMRLVGGGVAWCLEPKFYQVAFEREGGRPNQPFFDKESKSDFDELCKNRFEEPDELDFRITLNSFNKQTISTISDALPKHIAKTCEISEKDVKQKCFFKQCLTDKDGNLYSLRRIGDKKEKFIEFAIGCFDRHSAFSYDALQIPIERDILSSTNRSPKAVAAQGTIPQATNDYILKRLQAISPETLNEYAWSLYIIRRAQGCCSYDKELELKLCQKVSLFTTEEKMALLLHGYENHCGNHPEMKMTILFHACSTLCDNGFIKDAEELRAAATPICETVVLNNPIFQALSEIWFREECSFLQIRAVLESLGLFYLLSSSKKESVMSKIDEHNKQKIIQLIIQNNHFSLPLNPQHTFQILADVCKHSSFPHLQKFFKEWAPHKAFKFSEFSSPSVAQFLTIKISTLEQINDQWPQLLSVCTSLKKSLFPPQNSALLQTQDHENVQNSFTPYIYNTMDIFRSSYQGIKKKLWFN